MKKLFISLLFLLLGAGCQTASPPPPPKPPVAAAPVLTWVDTLPQRAATLPAAQVTTAAGSVVTITYPQESLFAPGSVLPLAGGAEALDPLVALLRAYPEAVWDATVRAATPNGAEYDLSLAQKRSELLQRYLRQGGVVSGQVFWQAKSGDGIPLELTLRPPQPLPGSSSRVKE